jgi:hypothetical protein
MGGNMSHEYCGVGMCRAEVVLQGCEGAEETSLRKKSLSLVVKDFWEE